MKKILFLFLLLATTSYPQNSQLAEQAAEQAEQNYDQGNIQGSINNYLKAIDIEVEEAEPDSSFLGLCNNSVGFLYWNIGNLNEADAHYKLAENIYLKTNDKEGQGEIYKWLGKLYLGLNYDDALNYYQKAYQLSVELKNILSQEICLNDMGLIYYHTAKHGEALESFKKALELAMQIENNPEEPIAIFNNIGLVYYATGDYQMALNYYQKSYDLHDSLNSSNSMILVLVNIASSYNNLGDQEKSIEYYYKAINDAKSREDKAEEAGALSYLGFAYFNWGLYDLALESQSKTLAIYEDLNMTNAIGNCKNLLALVHLNISNYALANEYFKESLVIAKASGNLYLTATILNNLGEGNRLLGYYDKALQRHNESLEISLNAGYKEAEAISLNGIGLIYFEKGDYLSSIEYFEKALKFFYSMNKTEHIPTALNNIGMAYLRLGLYDIAIIKYNESYNLSLTNGSLIGQANAKNNIGLVYFSWGKYEFALDYFEQALGTSVRNNFKRLEATTLTNIGNVYLGWGGKDKAGEYFKKAYDIFLLTEDLKSMASTLNSIGSLLEHNPSEALKFFNRSIQIYKELGIDSVQASPYYNIGLVYDLWNKFDTALIYFSKVRQIAKNVNDISSEAVVLNSLGNIYSYIGNNTESIKSYEASLTIKEQLRKTATGDIKRDYLSENLFVYNNLISTYLDIADNKNAFRINEQSKARYLMEQLSKGNISSTFVEYNDFSIPKNSALISFANSTYNDKIVFTLKGNDNLINSAIISDTIFFQNDFSDSRFDEQLATIRKRGAAISKKEDNDRELIKDLVEDENFNEIINHYRLLLANPFTSHSKLTEGIGRALYNYLIKPIKDDLKGSEVLIIIPDGVLSNIPFECLIDENGNYLAEQYIIQYTPSLSILNFLNARNYDHNNEKILAIGNPVYDVTFNIKDSINTNQDLLAFRKQLDYSIKRNEKLGQYYGDLGHGYWTTLDGTEKEINEIASTFNNVKTLMGEHASEKSIRELSNSGELKEYDIIHFSTHGITFPEAPELSALVLSQIETDKNDDGYLRIGEIENLKIRANFVNLSACETGLGKIYGGEGVVGLTQAFLVAGANGLSVSLWQIADKSTAIFMTELYKLVKAKNISYPKAMTEIKRRFIQGEYGPKYSQPFYWAPFVYYGKE